MREAARVLWGASDPTGTSLGTKEKGEGQEGHLPGPNRPPRLPSTLASLSGMTRRRKWQIRRRRIACSGKYVGALLTLATGGVATVRVAIN